MKKMTFYNAILTILLSACGLLCQAQPCVSDIITDPYNPVNNQFNPMAEAWIQDITPVTFSHNPWLNTSFNWYLVRTPGDDRKIQLFPSQVNWAHPFFNDIDTLDMLNPYSGSMPSQFKYLRNDNVAPANWDYRWEDGWELLWMNMGYSPLPTTPISAYCSKP